MNRVEINLLGHICLYDKLLDFPLLNCRSIHIHLECQVSVIDTSALVDNERIELK